MARDILTQRHGGTETAKKMRLGDVCELNMGQSPASGSYNESSEGLPFYQGNADFGVRTPTPRVWCSAPTKIANAGDILISVRAPIGALNFATEKCCIGRGLAALTPKDGTDSLFVYYALKTKTADLNQRGTGSTFKAINKRALSETQIPLPPLADQKRIAAILDKICEMKRNAEARLQKLDLLVKARFVEMFGDAWNRLKKYPLEAICKFITVGIANSATHAYADNGVVMLRNQNIRENRLDESDIAHIKQEFANKYRAKALAEGDLIVTRTGYPGIACVVPRKYVGCQTFTTLIVRLHDQEKTLPIFVSHFINSQYGKEYVATNKVGVAQQNFGATALSGMPIVVPPLSLQRQFAAFVEKVEGLKATAKKELEQVDLLYRAKLQEYFG